jgi:very-short-patch-repair endonuclease
MDDPVSVGGAGQACGVQIRRVLREQAGVISRSQAVAAGMSADQVDRRLRKGRWRRLHPCVYLVADRELTNRARIHAAVLWAGEDATLSGVAAAWWHQLWGVAPSTIDATVPLSQSGRSRGKIRIRRRELDWLDRTHLNGIWVTNVALTVLEAAVALGGKGQQLLDRALQRRVRFEDLVQAHSRNVGRRGSKAAGDLLRSCADRAASEGERAVIRLMRAAGITGWVRGYWFGGCELDFAFPELRVAVEVDGWAWHVDVERFRHDRRRQNILELAGWTVLRFTWHDLTERPEHVVAEIKAALARRPAA